MFDELNGIEKLRQRIQQDKSRLETLLDTGLAMVNKYGSLLDSSIKNLDETEKKLYSIYTEIFEQTNMLSHFDEKDIVSLIHTNSFSDNFSEDESKIFGIYTSALVDTLSKRNKKIGKKTIISIEDAHLDYLFLYLHDADIISINNSTGYGILSNAASFGGSIKYISLNKVNGDDLVRFSSSSLSSDSAYQHGFIETVQIRNCCGNNLLADSSSIDFLDIQDCKGNAIASYSNNKNTFLKNINGNMVAFGITGTKQNPVKLLVLEDIIGNSTAKQVSSSGYTITTTNLVNKKKHISSDVYTDIVLLRNIIGDHTASEMCMNNGDNMNLFYLENVRTDSFFITNKYLSSGNINLVMINNPPDYLESRCRTKSIKSQLNYLSSKFKKQFKNYRINELYDLFNSIPFGIENITEINEKLKQIDAVYNSIERIDTKYTKGEV